MNDLHSTIGQMLSGGNGGDVSSRLHDMLLDRLNQRPPGDPLRDVLGQMLMQRQQPARNRQADPRELLRAARDALTVLGARNAILAAALGACPECWGVEPGCPNCNGSGKPGWVAPDEAAFAAWVAPAIHAMTQPAHGERSNERTQ